MRKWVIGLLLLTALASLLTPAPAAAADAPPGPPQIMLDGLPLSFEVPPQIMRDRTMVPFRAIAEALGVDVQWFGETRSILARGLGSDVGLTIDQTTAHVNGMVRLLDAPPTIVNNRTLVPLRFFSEAFGAKVDWDPITRTVTVVSPIRPMRTLAFYAVRAYEERALVGRFSDAAYGWSDLMPDGSLNLTTGEHHWPEPDGAVSGESLLADAARAHTQRHLMVYASDRKDEYTKLVQDPALVTKAADAIAAAVKAKGFDGAVIDVEGLGMTEQGEALAKIRQGFTSLVQAVADRLHPAGKQVIVALHPLNGAYHGYDYKAVAAAADLIEVMAHDYIDHRTDQGPNPEPADRVDEAITLALQQVSGNQLLLGIVSSYETSDTIRQKVGLAKRHSLAGISVWRLGTLGAERMAALDTSVSPQKDR